MSEELQMKNRHNLEQKKVCIINLLQADAPLMMQLSLLRIEKDQTQPRAKESMYHKCTVSRCYLNDIMRE